MKTLLLSITLLWLLVTPLSGQTTNQPSPQEQTRVWLDSNAPTQRRLEMFFIFTHGNEGEAALRSSYAANPKAVSDALVFSFDHGHAGHQCLALYLSNGLQDRTAYSRMVEPALRSSDHEVRRSALGVAAFFDDRSEAVVSAALAELRSTNSSSNHDLAGAVAAKWQLQEAIEPLIDSVANSSLGWARTAAESLARYPSLPAGVLTRLEAARTRFEREQAEEDKRPKTATREWLEKERKANGTPTEFELLFKALDKAKEKALLPPAPSMEPSKTVKETRKSGKSAVDGKNPPLGSPLVEKASPASSANPSGTGRSNLLLFLGLASVAVIAWFLLKGRAR